MRVATRYATVPVTVMLAVSLAAHTGVHGADVTPDYSKERAQRARGLTEPYGWFSLVALEWLKPGTITVGAGAKNNVVVAGTSPELVRLEQSGGKVTVVSGASSLRYRGQPVAPGLVLTDDETDAAALESGSLRMWAIDRGGKRYLRVKDAHAPARVHFHGLKWYPPSPRFRVEARWVPYTGSHTMRFMNKLGQPTEVQEPGYVEFAVDGKQVRLTPLEASERGLWFVFRDATAPRETDGGGRFLTTEAPSHGLNKPGTVVLDFNKAVNPPCAYSPFATCPLAAPENRIAVAVPAGEKLYEQE